MSLLSGPIQLAYTPVLRGTCIYKVYRFPEPRLTRDGACLEYTSEVAAAAQLSHDIRYQSQNDLIESAVLDDQIPW